MEVSYYLFNWWCNRKTEKLSHLSKVTKWLDVQKCGCRFSWTPLCIILEHHTEWYSIHEFMVDSSPGEMGASGGEERGEERNTLQKNANSQGRRNEKINNLQSSVQETTRDAEIIGWKALGCRILIWFQRITHRLTTDDSGGMGLSMEIPGSHHINWWSSLGLPRRGSPFGIDFLMWYSEKLMASST